VVFSDGLYEIQVLDSYENKTYADGQAAAVYGQYPPLVNAARPPGQCRVTTSFFMARASTALEIPSPRRVTVLHNGVLVQDNVELSGPTAHKARPPYSPQPENCALALAGSQNIVRRFRITGREILRKANDYVRG